LSDVWDAPDDDLETSLKKARLKAPHRAIESIRADRDEALDKAYRTLDSLSSRGVRLIVDSAPEFPRQLRNLNSAPRWLFVQGNHRLLTRHSAVAVVGTREASPAEISLTSFLCELLVEAGQVTISGLADGIDATTHEATIQLGGETVAVLG